LEIPYLSEDGEALSDLMFQIGNHVVSSEDATLGRDLELGTNTVWLAAYTTPRHEKTVARHLGVRGIECFLPLYKVIRKWRNGCKVELELPIFPNYVFVRTALTLSSKVLAVPGVVAFAGSERAPATISDNEIDWLKTDLPRRRFEPHAYLAVGSRVRIMCGSLAGMSGVLLRQKSGLRVVLSVELIRQSVAVEVAANEIEPVRA
jgi:transcription antitermination factor NusG